MKTLKVDLEKAKKSLCSDSMYLWFCLRLPQHLNYSLGLGHKVGNENSTRQYKNTKQNKTKTKK